MAWAPFSITFSAACLSRSASTLAITGLAGRWFDQDDVAGGEFFGGQGQHVADDRAQVLFAKLQLHRPREVHQRLHHAVEPANLRVDHFQVADRRARWGHPACSCSSSR